VVGKVSLASLAAVYLIAAEIGVVGETHGDVISVARKQYSTFDLVQQLKTWGFPPTKGTGVNVSGVVEVREGGMTFVQAGCPGPGVNR
jgi:hypothetical protein